MQDTIENLEWEVWKDIQGYEWHYMVSNLWNVYSIKSELKLKLYLNSKWYPTVMLYIDGNRSNISVHRLVSIAFIPNPENKRTVNHINGIRNDNRLSNLEWATYSENNKHSFDFLWRKPYMLWKLWFDCFNSKPVCQISKDWIYKNMFWSMAEAERYTWIHKANISRCCLGVRKYAWWYKWEFYQGIER